MPEKYVYPNECRADILKMLPPDGQVIGTVGCGYAATEGEMVKAGRIVYGVDIAPQVEKVASERLTKFQLIKPGDPLPWGADSLDGLVLADVIEHIPQAWEVLALWAKCVKPGGWVVISVPNMRSLATMGRFVLTGDWPERDSGIFDRTHLQVMSMKRLLRWGKAAGLKPERTFSSYNGSPSRRMMSRIFDACTLWLFRTWSMHQLQVVFRVLPRDKA